jgi:hypothetical protein
LSGRNEAFSEFNFQKWDLYFIKHQQSTFDFKYPRFCKIKKLLMTHNGGRGCQNNQNNAVIPNFDACLLIIEFLSPHFDFIFGLPFQGKVG